MKAESESRGRIDHVAFWHELKKRNHKNENYNHYNNDEKMIKVIKKIRKKISKGREKLRDR